VEDLSEAIGSVREVLGDRRPEVLLTLGSGLSGVADRLGDAVEVRLDRLPGFAPSTVPGHRSRLRCGSLAGRTVLAQLGRLHLYEGHDAATVTRPVELAAALGCGAYVVTNAAGGVDPDLEVGDLMVIEDHLNLTGASPLLGRLRDGAPMFVDMADAYDVQLQELAHEAAGSLGLRLRSGVYAGLVGPAYETPAEVAMLRGLGARAVGMSTVNEVIAARAHGLRVLGLSSITNVHRPGVPTTHEEVLDVGARVAEDLARVLVETLTRWPVSAAGGG
jgi:purine-nucleoside phosphorylase